MIEVVVKDYYANIDTALEQLSLHEEQTIVNLPPWLLCTRQIQIGRIANKDFYVIKVMPDRELKADVVEQTIFSSITEVGAFTSPHWPNLDFSPGFFDQKQVHFTFGGIQLTWYGLGEIADINAVPAFDFPGELTMVSGDMIPEVFSDARAKEQAIDFWNNAKYGLKSDRSFVIQLQTIFDRFRDACKLKGFKERRIHRYLREYANFLLPEFQKCYFEHRLYLAGEKRVADFILERSHSQPALLIELESPVARSFTKAGDYTKEANHARQQISEWVQFIEGDHTNAQGDMAFLRGPKDRLVIIGKGLDRQEKMQASRYDDTLIWTYDVLIREAKTRMNKIIADQCRILGIENPNLIH